MYSFEWHPHRHDRKSISAICGMTGLPRDQPRWRFDVIDKFRY